MSEPVSTGTIAVAAAAGGTAAGLVIFGVATGLHPHILFAGLAGGLWSQSYPPPMPPARRVLTTLLAALIAGYLAPTAAAAADQSGLLAGTLSRDALALPLALLIGLLSHRVLGPWLIRLAETVGRQKIEEAEK